jgi:hypothetical protein
VQGPEEERAAKLGALIGAAVFGVLGTVCFLLLSLRINGQTDYPAWVIVSPVFGVLALIFCCGCCCACLASLMHRASRGSGGHPPYNEVRETDEEAALGSQSEASPPVPQAADELSPDEHPPRAQGNGVAQAAVSATDDNQGAPSGAESFSVPAVMPNPVSEIAAGAQGVGLNDEVEQLVQVDRPEELHHSNSGLAVSRDSTMSVRDLRSALTSKGINHDHCIEKEELQDLLRRS